MKLHRREFMALGSLALLRSAGAFAGQGAGGEPLFISAASTPDGRHWVRGFGLEAGRAVERFRHALPERAHHVAVHEDSGLYVVLARRPGAWMAVGDLDGGRAPRVIRVPADRHLFGHGVFSSDGARFYSVESDFEDMEGDSGLLSVWEVDGGEFARAAEYRTHGVGPHELVTMPGGEVLAVANGGIRTHPDSERENLNPDTMQPSLVYLDAATGALLEKRQLAPEYHQASIRHLDVNGAGLVALAMQYEGLPFEDVPLVALHARGGDIRFPDVPQEVQQRMKQYCGSVRYDASGRYFAVSCPRGNMITFWDTAGERFLESQRSRDGCGVCAAGEGFLFTAGTGRIAWYDAGAGESRDLEWTGEEPLFWDNHLSIAMG